MLLSNKFLWLILLFWKIEENNAKLTRNENLQGTLKRETINVIEKVFLKRQKRFLIFEKGAAVTFQANIGKAIISNVPRGLNELAEYTLTYDLPYEVDFDSLHLKKHITTKTKTKTSTTSTIAPIWHYKNLPQYEKFDENLIYAQKWQPSKQLWCPKQHIFQKYYNEDEKKNFERCTYKHRVKRQRFNYATKKAEQLKEIPAKNNSIESMMLFDIITQLSRLHDFNPRHCIMRTLCESQHLLLPPGQLLFHDLVRILLSHAQPATQRHAPFRAAFERENLQECTQLYGLHCRWSFLQHFTKILTYEIKKNSDNLSVCE